MARFRFWNSYSDKMRRNYAERLARNAADAPARALRLSPQAVSYWTDVIAQSAKSVDPTSCPDDPRTGRPCATGPWRLALEDHLKNRPHDSTPPLERASQIAGLITISQDIAQPGWPDPRRDLIDFALTYLEADVMLFGSGYKKKHLIRRVQQSPLVPDDIARIDGLLRRAVTDGTGLEEYRAYRRLAGHMVAGGYLPELVVWLEEVAKGAIVDAHSMRYPAWYDFPQRAQLTKQDFERLSKTGWRDLHPWGIIYPALTDVVENKRANRTAADKTRRNAFVMLAHIKRRHNSPVWQPLNEGLPSGRDID